MSKLLPRFLVTDAFDSGTHTPLARGPDARSILRAQAQLDFDSTLEFLRERFRKEKDAGAAAAAAAKGIEAVVMGAIRVMGVRKRLARDVDKLVDLALRVHAGADADAVARAHVRDMLRLREMSLFVRVKDPAFRGIVQHAERLFAKRLPDLARLATVPDPGDYPTLVRRAFPDVSEVDALVAENGADMIGILEHAEKHPHLVRAVPDAWVPKAVAIGRDFVTWKVDAVRRDVRAFYEDAPSDERPRTP